MHRILFLILIVVAALGVRLGAVAALRGFSTPPSYRHGADGVEFDVLGTRLANDGAYAYPGAGPTSFRAPGFPFFLASIYATVGRRLPLVYAIFAALGAASCALTYLLAREVVAEPVARIAAILAVVFLPHILFATRFDSENLFVPVLAAALWLFLRSTVRGGPGQLVVAGLLLGCGALVRPFALLLLPLWALIVLLRWPGDRARRVAMAAALALAFSSPIAPWTCRNWLVHGTPVLIATNGGSTFYGSNNDLVATVGPSLGGLGCNQPPARSRPDRGDPERGRPRQGRMGTRDPVGPLASGPAPAVARGEAGEAPAPPTSTRRTGLMWRCSSS